MANKARKYHYAESLTTSTSTVTTDTTKVTLTFTPDASSNYLYIWSCDVAASVITSDVRVSLNNNGGTVLSATNVEPADITDWITVSGIAFETFGASPTSQSVTLRFSAELNTITASIKNAKIIAIKLTSADVYTENTTDQTTTSSTYQTAATLTFTPATTGSYLILGSCESRGGTTSVSAVSTQLLYNAVSYGQSDIIVNDTTNYFSGMMQANVGSLTNTSKTITMQWKNGNNTTTVYCRRARIVALRLDEFTTSSIAEVAAGSTTTSLTYTNKVSNAASTTNGLSYLVIGTAIAQGSTGSSTSFSSGYGISVDGTYITESLIESGSVSGYYGSSRFGAFTVATASGSTLTANIDYYAETVSVASGISQATVSVLLLDPTDLYWVGGSGTWDSSTTTNWALTSGGTGSVAAPKIGTNVNFDANSDSSAIFTVTVSTGAVCKNLTASGLDNTMTLSGSAAMSVYGSFSVPATNFTQSYTGTITFASTSSQTITSNGKSFSGFVFDGVGGTWTLQDAATTSGTATLTNGTLALSSYTFTCSKFASNGSTTRSINFGTGKIVLTSALTEAVWSTSTVTNLTISGTPLVQLTGGGATTKTISTGALSEANSISFQLSTTAGTVTFTASDIVKNLTIDNNSFTLSNIAITLYGSLTISGTSPTLTAGANALTFGATSGSYTITTSGKTLDFPITFGSSASTATWALQDALTVGTATSRTVTLTAGTLELNSYTFTLYGVFSSANTNTRRIQMSGSGGKIVITLDTATTVWSTGNITNMTTDGNIVVQLTGGGATTKTIATANIAEAYAISFQISCTAGTVALGSGNFKNLTIDNNSITISNSAITIFGNLLIGAAVTLTAGVNAWTFGATSGTYTITTNGKTLDYPIIFNGTGGTWQLQDALTVGSTRLTTLTAGTININSLTLTTGTFAVTGAAVKVLTHGTNGNLVVSGSGATAFNATGSNLTSTGTGLINMTSASAKTFVGNGNSYNTLNQGGAGALTITGSNIFKNITNTVQPATVTFTSGTTNTFTVGFGLSGTSGNLITIGSTSTTNHTLTKTFSSAVIVSYCSISRSTVDATGWYAPPGLGNVDGSNNLNWIFAAAPSGNMFMIFI